jgi:hypothetical protein
MIRSAEWLGSKPSSVMVRGSPCCFRALLKNALAAVLSRVRLRCEATARPAHRPRPDLCIGLVTTPGSTDRPLKWTLRPAETFRVPHHPAQDCARCYQHTQLLCDFSHLPMAELEPQVPAHTQDDHFTAKATAAKQWIAKTWSTHSILSRHVKLLLQQSPSRSIYERMPTVRQNVSCVDAVGGRMSTSML